MDPLRPVSGDPAAVVPALEAWLGTREEPEPLVVETAGTTGRPKRVLLPRTAFLASATGAAKVLGWSGPWVLALQPGYVGGLQTLVRSLLAGVAPLVAAEHGGLVGAVRAAAEPPAISMVSPQLHRALREPEALAALRECRAVLVGGGPVWPELRRRAVAARVPLVAAYGATETTGGCVFDGRPFEKVQLQLDGEGRIRVGGPTVFEGYEGQPDLTASSLVDGWFLTSDRGRIAADGRLEVLGRIDDVVVSGGVNIPVSEVVGRLFEHPDVRDAAAVGVPDPEWGQRLVAFVVGELSLGDARDWVATDRPRAWAPRELHVVDALPVLPSGKVDQRALESRARGA